MNRILSIVFFLGMIFFCQAQISFTEDISPGFTESNIGSIALSDIDGDNDQDIVITGLDGSSEISTKLYINNGNGDFSKSSTQPFIDVFRSAIAFIDVDGDTDEDLLITGSGGGTKAELYTNDNGIFNRVDNSGLRGIKNGSLAFADVDGDTDQDIFLSGDSDGVSEGISELYINDGSGVFSKSIGSSFDPFSFYSSVAFADVDGDTDQDLFITGFNDIINRTVAKLYKNDGDGNFTEVINTTFNALSYAVAKFADIDGDTDQDLLIFGKQGTISYRIELYENDGDGNFTEAMNSPLERFSDGPNTSGSVAFSDVDEDSDLDILISGGFETNLYENTGNGIFSKVTGVSFVGLRNSSVAFADIDGDNDKDLLTIGIGEDSFEATAKLYINETQILGIEESIIDNNFIGFYPNPVYSNDEIIINTEVASVVIYDNLGKRVFSTKKNKFMIDNLPSGIYFMEIENKKRGKISRQLVKM